MRTRQLLWKQYEPNVAYGELVFSPDNTKLARTGLDSTFKTIELSRRPRLLIYDVATGRKLLRPTEETPLDVMKLAHTERMVPKNRVFFSHPQGTPVPRPAEDGPINAMAWSPDSRMLAVDYSYGALKLWRVP